MALSRRLLDLLEALDYPETRIEYLIEYFQVMSKDEPLFSSAEEQAEAEAERKLIRLLTSSVVKIKQGPSRESSSETLLRLFEDFGSDDLLDAHFTTQELQRIPGIIERWKNLQAFQVALLPGERITHYLRQATTCYLYGLSTAAAILCRTVLQFALEWKLGTLGGMDLSKMDRRDGLNNLITIAERTTTGKTRILPPELARKARSIQKAGSAAAHKGTCSESKALTTIKGTGEVLAHIYGQTK